MIGHDLASRGSIHNTSFSLQLTKVREDHNTSLEVLAQENTLAYLGQFVITKKMKCCEYPSSSLNFLFNL
jgi:hypothetical protein